MLKILLSLKKFLRYSFKNLLKFAFQIWFNPIRFIFIHPIYKKSSKIPPFTHVKLTMNFQFEISIEISIRIRYCCHFLAIFPAILSNVSNIFHFSKFLTVCIVCYRLSERSRLQGIRDSFSFVANCHELEPGNIWHQSK